MAFVSEQTLARLRNEVALAKSKGSDAARKRAAKAKEKQEQLVAVGIATGAAAAVGYVRGRLEKDGKSFEIMGVDAEAVIGTALVLAPIAAPKLGKKTEDALIAAG